MDMYGADVRGTAKPMIEEMTIRDYFAAATLQGMLSAGVERPPASDTKALAAFISNLVGASYTFADVMIMKRKAGSDETASKNLQG